MYITRLSLLNFRNYKNETVALPHGRLVISGANAQGKTNLLEAVYYLSTARSFRAAEAAELIRAGCESAVIEAEVMLYDRPVTLRVEFARQGRRLFVNGVRERKTAEFAGRLRTVLFTPNDLNIVQSGSAERRRFIDLALSQIKPRYADAIDRYNKLHVGKTRILRDPSMSDALEAYNQKIAELGAIIISYRARYAQKAASYAAAMHSEITDGAESLEISYKTLSTIPDPFADRAQIQLGILEHMHTHAEQERQRGLALSGPHRDDLVVLINGTNARRYASQGQARTAALSLKLAERRLLCESTPEADPPVLLLDDVLSELDASRRAWIVGAETGGQILITACEPTDAMDRITIKQGRIYTNA